MEIVVWLLKKLSEFRLWVRRFFLPRFWPAPSNLVPSLGRYLLLRPFAFELWFRSRAVWYLITRGWSVSDDSEQVKPVNRGHFSRVVEHNFGNRWLFSRARTEKLMNILRCVAGVWRQSRVLVVGPRNEAEILLLSLYGFKLKNITGVDLATYSPLIRRMDMHNLEFADNSFDVVYVLYTLSYSYDLGKACAEIVRVLRNDGLVAVGFQHTPRASPLRTKSAELSGGLSELLGKFEPHVQHVYWQEAAAVSGPDGDHLVTAIFSIRKDVRVSMTGWSS